MRLRQICLVAENLQSSLETLAGLLASPVIYRDPEVAHFGLENGLIMTGGDFVEVVSPLARAGDTAAGRHLARRGNSFYMAIFQCADANPLIAHIMDNGGRDVFELMRAACAPRIFIPGFWRRHCIGRQYGAR